MPKSTRSLSSSSRNGARHAMSLRRSALNAPNSTGRFALSTSDATHGADAHRKAKEMDDQGRIRAVVEPIRHQSLRRSAISRRPCPSKIKSACSAWSSQRPTSR